MDTDLDTDRPVDVQFENLPNFRQVGGIGLTNKHGQKIRDGLLYRSSRTDFITAKDKELFQQLGIKAIFDLRRQGEYERSDGEKRLDDMYKLVLLEKGDVIELKPSFRWGTKNMLKATPNPVGYRYLVNMMSMELIWHIFYQLNFFIRWLSLILVLFDWLFGCHFFTKFYCAMVLNHQPVSYQYFQMLEYCKPAIADILRQMLQPGNLPALVHCAHGKDRTGLMAAILLGCLDIEDDVIVEDYAKSEVRASQDIVIVKLQSPITSCSNNNDNLSTYAVVQQLEP